MIEFHCPKFAIFFFFLFPFPISSLRRHTVDVIEQLDVNHSRRRIEVVLKITFEFFLARISKHHFSDVSFSSQLPQCYSLVSIKINNRCILSSRRLSRILYKTLDDSRREWAVKAALCTGAEEDSFDAFQRQMKRKTRAGGRIEGI